MIDNKNDSILYIFWVYFEKNKFEKKNRRFFSKFILILEAKNKLEGLAEILQL